MRVSVAHTHWRHPECRLFFVVASRRAGAAGTPLWKNSENVWRTSQDLSSRRTEMKSFIRLFFILALCLSSALWQNAAAQNGKGSISGHVTDVSGSVLQGAEIELQPGPITTASKK